MAKERRSGSSGRISLFLKSIFSREKIAASVTKKNEKKPSKKVEKKEPEIVIDFGIGETEKLTHFNRAKPPSNRRLPKGAPKRAPRSRTALRNELQRQKSAPIPNEEPKKVESQESKEPLSLELLSVLRKRSDTVNAKLRNDENLALDEDRAHKGLSKSEPFLNHASDDEEGLSKEKTFVHLLKNEAASSRDENLEPLEEECEDEEGNEVQVRRKSLKILRSESVGHDPRSKSYQSYKELVKSTRRSSRP